MFAALIDHKGCTDVLAAVPEQSKAGAQRDLAQAVMQHVVSQTTLTLVTSAAE